MRFKISLHAAMILVSALAGPVVAQQAAAPGSAPLVASAPVKAAASKTSNGNPALPPGQAGPQMTPSNQQGSAPASPNAGLDSSASETTTAIPLKITLTPSETPLKLGSTSNIAATIQNISSKPVRVELNTLQLTTHSIVASGNSLCVMAMSPNYNYFMTPEVVLQPEDQVSVLFNLSQGAVFGAGSEQVADTIASASASTTAARAKLDYQSKMVKALQNSCKPDMLDRIRRTLDFSPGNYDYFLSGYFTLCPPATTTTAPTGATGPVCTLPMRPIALSATFPVGIDQFEIICFAVAGGWLALLVMTFNDPSRKTSVIARFAAVRAESSSGWQRFWERLWSSDGFHIAVNFAMQVVGTALLSAAFTIVSSRMSDSQLPIKITVLDAWGAMTIGFLSFFVGKKFIAMLARWGASSDAKTADDVRAQPVAATVVAHSAEIAVPASSTIITSTTPDRV